MGEAPRRSGPRSTQSSKKRERTPVWPIRENVNVDLLLLKGTHKNHINAMIFLSKKFF